MKLTWSSWPALVVAKEKYGTTYMLAKDEPDLYRHALWLVWLRLKQNWYGKPEPIRPFTILVDEIPTELRTEALNLQRRHKRDASWFEQALEDWNDIELALKHKDGALAWQVLQRRADHEYEDVHLEVLETTEHEEASDKEWSRFINDPQKE